MSKATKMKYVMDEVMIQELTLPTENQAIVKIVASKGNNLHEVENAEGERFLMSMPPKYRKNVWVKRGDFVLVEPIEEGDKVKAEMVLAITGEHIDHYKEGGVWPDKFTAAKQVVLSDSSDSDSDLGIGRNTNRPHIHIDKGSSSSSDDADSEDSSSEDEATANRRLGD